MVSMSGQNQVLFFLLRGFGASVSGCSCGAAGQRAAESLPWARPAGCSGRKNTSLALLLRGAGPRARPAAPHLAVGKEPLRGHRQGTPDNPKPYGAAVPLC